MTETISENDSLRLCEPLRSPKAACWLLRENRTTVSASLRSSHRAPGMPRHHQPRKPWMGGCIPFPMEPNTPTTHRWRGMFQPISRSCLEESRVSTSCLLQPEAHGYTRAPTRIHWKKESLLRFGYHLSLKGSHIVNLIPRIVILGGGGTFKQWGLVGAM